MYRFIINPRYIQLFVELEKGTKTIADLARVMGANYAHLSTVIDQFHKEGLIIKVRKQRTCEITVTAMGNAAAEHLFAINDIMLNWEKSQAEEKASEKPQDKSNPVGVNEGDSADALSAALNGTKEEPNGNK